MSEENGNGLVVPIVVMYQLRAELDAALGKLADAERKIVQLMAEAATLRKECEQALGEAATPAAAAMLQRVRLRAELKDLRPG